MYGNFVISFDFFLFYIPVFGSYSYINFAFSQSVENWLSLYITRKKFTKFNAEA